MAEESSTPSISSRVSAALAMTIAPAAEKSSIAYHSPWRASSANHSGERVTTMAVAPRMASSAQPAA